MVQCGRCKQWKAPDSSKEVNLMTLWTAPSHENPSQTWYKKNKRCSIRISSCPQGAQNLVGTLRQGMVNDYPEKHGKCQGRRTKCFGDWHRSKPHAVLGARKDFKQKVAFETDFVRDAGRRASNGKKSGPIDRGCKCKEKVSRAWSILLTLPGRRLLQAKL